MLGRVSINLSQKQLKFLEVYRTADGEMREPDHVKMENLGLKYRKFCCTQQEKKDEKI